MGALNNARWVALSQAVKIGAQVLGMVILARLVPPAEYGIMAMATVATNFAMIFRDMGSSAALIQKSTLDESVKNAAFWFNIMVGTGIALIIVCLAPLIARGFHSPKLVSALTLLAIAFPLSSSAAVHQALLERESQFKVVARIEIAATIIGLAAAIVLAWFGIGVYSLVAQTLITMGLSSLQLWIASAWWPRGPRGFSWSDLRPILGFSSNLVGFNIVNYFSRNADSMIIGHFFSAAMLGAYSLAYRVMLFPLQSLTFVASRSLYPVLARQQHNVEEMKNTYLRVVVVVVSLVAPMMAGMVVLRQSFINIFLGTGWDLTAQLLLWLAPTGFIQSILSTTGVVFMATGATHTLMRLGILGAILQVGAFLLGLPYGVEAMVRWYLLANILNFIPVMMLCMRQMDGKLMEIVVILKVPVVASAVMVILLEAIIHYATQISMQMVGFSILVVFGAAVYLFVYFVIGRKQLSILFSSLGREKKSGVV